MTDEQLYLRRGRRYLPVGRFTGFPADGIWLVKSDRGGRSERVIYPTTVAVERLGDLPEAAPLVEAEMLRDAVEEGLRRHYASILDLYYEALRRRQDHVHVGSLADMTDRIVVEIATRLREEVRADG